MGERSKPNPEEMKKWEELLAKEGMPAEVSPDAAAEELKEAAGTKPERWSDNKALRREIQLYWQFRPDNVGFGDHYRAVLEITTKLGLDPAEIDEATVKEIEDEVSEAQRGVQDLIDVIQKREGRTDILPRRMANMLMREASKRFRHLDEVVLRDIVDRAAGTKDDGH